MSMSNPNTDEVESDNPSDKAASLKLALIAAFCLLLIAVIYFSPVGTGGDWNVLTTALRGWSSEGKELYDLVPASDGQTMSRYTYSPFATLIMLPFAWLPPRLVWSVMAISNNLILLYLCRKFEVNIWNTLLLLTSPAALYTIIFGQVDISFLIFILLPDYLWGLVALLKPQLLIGMGVEAFRSKRLFIQTAIICAVALGLSLLFFGNWYEKMVALSLPLGGTTHNMMRLIWPYGIPIGLAFFAAGYWKKDRLLYLAGSPFLSFYAHTGSLIGLALALSKHLKSWLFLIVWLIWWLVLVFVL